MGQTLVWDIVPGRGSGKREFPRGGRQAALAAVGKPRGFREAHMGQTLVWDIVPGRGRRGIVK